jgi:hypothetical protein
VTHWYTWLALVVMLADAHYSFATILVNAWSDPRTGRSTARPIVSFAASVTLALMLVAP